MITKSAPQNILEKNTISGELRNAVPLMREQERTSFIRKSDEQKRTRKESIM